MNPRASFIDSRQLFMLLMVPIVLQFARGERAAKTIDVIIAIGAAGALVGIVQYAVLGYNHLEARPRSTMAAQYSLPFTTAVALLGDPADPSSFGDAARDDPALLALADKVVAVHDEAFQRAVPAHFGGAIAIVRRDGSRVEHRVLDSKGTPAKPADRATLHAKFAAMTAARLDEAGRVRLLRAIDALERMTTIDALIDALPKQFAQASPRSAVAR